MDNLSVTFYCPDCETNARRRDGSTPRCPQCRKDMVRVDREDRLQPKKKRKGGKNPFKDR